MSEIVQGAFIGIAGVIVGAIIGSISSYVIARLQINARSTEVRQQLEFQEREAKINHLIEARKEILMKLRNIVSDYVENSHYETAEKVPFRPLIKKEF